MIAQKIHIIYKDHNISISSIISRISTYPQEKYNSLLVPTDGAQFSALYFATELETIMTIDDRVVSFRPMESQFNPLTSV